MLQLEQIQWQTDGSALLRLSDGEDVRILAFSVTELSLHEGQQLSHDMLEQIQSAGRFREIYKKSLDLLARREHSIWELRQKLRQRFPGFMEVEPVLFEQALASEVDASDLRGKAEAFVRKSGFPTDPAAKRKLAQKLYQRGFSQELINQVLSQDPL